MLKKELSGKGSLVAKRIYRGAPPVANLIHVICAFLLLITNVFLVAKGKQLGIFEGNVAIITFALLGIFY